MMKFDILRLAIDADEIAQSTREGLSHLYFALASMRKFLSCKHHEIILIDGQPQYMPEQGIWRRKIMQFLKGGELFRFTCGCDNGWIVSQSYSQPKQVGMRNIKDFLMILYHFDIRWTISRPAKTNTMLCIDANDRVVVNGGQGLVYIAWSGQSMIDYATARHPDYVGDASHLF